MKITRLRDNYIIPKNKYDTWLNGKDKSIGILIDKDLRYNKDTREKEIFKIDTEGKDYENNNNKN